MNARQTTLWLALPVVALSTACGERTSSASDSLAGSSAVGGAENGGSGASGASSVASPGGSDSSSNAAGSGAAGSAGGDASAGDTGCSPGGAGDVGLVVDHGFTVSVESGGDIQQAVSTVLATGGGTVLLGRGIWTLTSTLNLGSNVTLRGTGAGTTIRGPGAVYSWPLISVADTAAVENLTVADLTVDGRVPESVAFDTSSPYADAFCLYFALPPDMGKNLTISGVEAHHCSESLHAKGFDGITITNSYFHDSGVMLSPTLGNHNFYLFRDNDVTISNVRSNRSWAGDGLHLRRMTGTTTIRNSTFVGNFRLGVHIQLDGSTVSDMIVTGNDLSYNGSAEHQTPDYSGLNMDGMNMEALTGVVTGNVAVGNSGSGIALFNGTGSADANICAGNERDQIASHASLTLGTNATQGPFADGNYRIVSRRSGRVLAPTRNASGSPVEQQDDAAIGAQKWALTNLGNDEYSFKNVDNGLLLDVSGASSVDGAAVVVATADSGTSHVWRAIPTGVGSYRLCPKHAPGTCLQIDQASSCAGARTVLHPYTAHDDEHWLVERL